jgi:hypothetical protein
MKLFVFDPFEWASPSDASLEESARQWAMNAQEDPGDEDDSERKCEELTAQAEAEMNELLNSWDAELIELSAVSDELIPKSTYSDCFCGAKSRGMPHTVECFNRGGK